MLGKVEAQLLFDFQALMPITQHLWLLKAIVIKVPKERQ